MKCAPIAFYLCFFILPACYAQYFPSELREDIVAFTTRCGA